MLNTSRSKLAAEVSSKRIQDCLKRFFRKHNFARMLLSCLLCIWLPMVNVAAEAPSELAPTDQCEGYPIIDYHKEEQGIYTGDRVPDKMLVFNVSEKSPLIDISSNPNETLFVRKKVIVRDECTTMQETLSPNLTELYEEKGDACSHADARSSFINLAISGQRLMAVWTFTIPENQCFMLEFYSYQTIGAYNSLRIKDGEIDLPVVMEPRKPWPYTRPRQNETATVSVVYFYRPQDKLVYWRMVPSVNCYEC